MLGGAFGKVNTGTRDYRTISGYLSCSTGEVIVRGFLKHERRWWGLRNVISIGLAEDDNSYYVVKV